MAQAGDEAGRPPNAITIINPFVRTNSDGKNQNRKNDRKINDFQLKYSAFSLASLILDRFVSLTNLYIVVCVCVCSDDGVRLFYVHHFFFLGRFAGDYDSDMINGINNTKKKLVQTTVS